MLTQIYLNLNVYIFHDKIEITNHTAQQSSFTPQYVVIFETLQMLK
jgi:hypothetical protein